MNTAADYLAAIVLALVGIALFLNVRGGTLGAWLRAKFLGVPTGTAAPQTIFQAA